MCLLLVVSAALGFAFNAANPVGVRFRSVLPSNALATVIASNEFRLVSSASTVPIAAAPVAPPLPPPPAHILATTTTAGAPPAAAAASATVPPVQTNLNPAPIHWREAKPLVAANQALMLDVRPRGAYDAGHIPDAISLPETTSPEEFAAFLKQVPTNLTLIVYCSSTTCSVSHRVANRLVQEFHWPAVKYMTGGYQEYQREELAQPSSP